MKTYTHNWMETEHGITLQAINRGHVVAAISYREQDKALIIHKPPTAPYGLATDCEALNGGYCEAKLLGSDRKTTPEIELIGIMGSRHGRYMLMETILDKMLPE